MIKGSFWFPFFLLATACALTLKTAHLPVTDKGLGHISVREALPYVRESFYPCLGKQTSCREDESCVRETLICVREHLPCVWEDVNQYITA